jgi:biopolymer transport protein ExbB
VVFSLFVFLFAARAQEKAGEAPVEAAQEHVGLTWWERIQQGRETGAIQILLSVFGAIFVFERFYTLRRKNIAPLGLTEKARRMWREEKYDALEGLAAREPSTLARLISFIARHRNEPLSDVSSIVGDMIAQEMTVHHQRAYPLGVVATLEPLLGLLGMIIGMIHTFEIVALAGALGDPTSLASGISEALVTTGLGLAIAIPFLALFHYFKTRTNMFGAILEKETTELMSEWLLGRKKAAAHVA